MSKNNVALNLKELEGVIEAILFASGEPVAIKNISRTIGQTEKFTQKIINSLIDKYNIEKRGIKIIKTDDTYQMCTNPDYFEYIKELYSIPQKKNLSQALLETLSIIAYKQPITKLGIENIRGVSCEHAVNALIKYELVEEKGRLEAIGRPILLGTTKEFLKYFGFSSLEEMPRIEEVGNEEIENIRNIGIKI